MYAFVVQTGFVIIVLRLSGKISAKVSFNLSELEEFRLTGFSHVSECFGGPNLN